MSESEIDMMCVFDAQNNMDTFCSVDIFKKQMLRYKDDCCDVGCARAVLCCAVCYRIPPSAVVMVVIMSRAHISFLDTHEMFKNAS